MDSELDLDQPFTREDLRSAGLAENLVRRREFVAVIRGVWMRRTRLDRFSVLRAGLQLHGEQAYASHLSAAEVHGLPVPEHHFEHVTVCDPKQRRYRPQLKVHVTGRRQRVVVVNGIRATDPVTTFIDCAGWLGLVALVVMGDALVKKFDVTAADLVAACRRSRDYYAKQALTAALLVRDGVDSPMETRLRLLIVLAGLPEPVVNHLVRRDDGSVWRRFDLCYPEIKLIVEYEGRQHAFDPEQWRKDLDRREEFDDEGYRILVVVAEGIFREPQRTLHRIRRQLVLRGMRNVPELDDAWREHFAS